MKACHVCGNNYDKCFTVQTLDGSFNFDCFECAIHALAPLCSHCQCRIIGHGLEDQENYYCCAHCAKESGTTTLKDRV